MTTSAINAFGVTLTRDGNAIAEITNLSAPNIALETVDVTSHDSVGYFREYIGGLLDAGEITMEGNFKASDTNGQVGLKTDQANRTVQTFVLTFPAAITATWTFTALVTQLQIGNFPIDGLVPFICTLKVTGQPTLAIAASADATTIAYEDSVGVKTSLPVFASATYGPYTLTVATASTYVKVTVTDATAASITVQATIAGTAGPIWNLTTAVQSGQIVIGAAATTTLLKIICTDTGEVPKTYTVYVVRP